eukprot:1409469-Alexandrium_andersonii.AAC.1
MPRSNSWPTSAFWSGSSELFVAPAQAQGKQLRRSQDVDAPLVGEDVETNALPAAPGSSTLFSLC